MISGVVQTSGIALSHATITLKSSENEEIEPDKLSFLMFAQTSVDWNFRKN